MLIGNGLLVCLFLKLLDLGLEFSIFLAEFRRLIYDGIQDGRHLASDILPGFLLQGVFTLLALCEKRFLLFEFFFVLFFETFDFLVKPFDLFSKLDIFRGDSPALFDAGRLFLSAAGYQYYDKTNG